MKRIKNILFLMIVCSVASCCVFVACNKKQEHVHSYKTEWTADENYHWHEPLCDDTEPQKLAHKFTDGKCEVCNYEKPKQKPGKDNSGDDNSGKDNSGDDNSGDDNFGDDNSGKDNSGDDNFGKDNSGGDDNSGDDNSGDDNSGKDNSGGDDNSGDDNSGEYNPGDDNSGQDEYYATAEEYFEGISFKDLTLNDDKNHAYELATRTERLLEMGKGFVSGDMVVESGSNGSMFGVGNKWSIQNLGIDLEKAGSDLRVCSEQFIGSGYTQNITYYYADMTSAYGPLDSTAAQVQKYEISDAAKYLARQGIDNSIYIVDKIADMAVNEMVTRKFAKIDDKYYLSFSFTETVSYGNLYSLTITTNLKVAFRNELLVALHYSEVDDMGSENYYNVYMTHFANNIEMPQSNVVIVANAPQWLPVPHKGNITDAIFSDVDLVELEDEKDREKLFEMCNKFYYSIYYMTGGMNYVAARVDLQIKMMLSGLSSEVTIDNSSSVNYLIHKKTSQGNELISEQYSDGEYLYEKIASSEVTTESEAEAEEYVTRKFDNEYGEYYLEFFYGEFLEQ